METNYYKSTSQHRFTTTMCMALFLSLARTDQNFSTVRLNKSMNFSGWHPDIHSRSLCCIGFSGSRLREQSVWTVIAVFSNFISLSSPHTQAYKQENMQRLRESWSIDCNKNHISLLACNLASLHSDKTAFVSDPRTATEKKSR